MDISIIDFRDQEQRFVNYITFTQIYQVANLMTSKNFNIKETVHKNIQNHQFPSFSNHRSLVGWCSMNYPKVLVNPIYLQKQQLQKQKKYELQSLFQQKNPIERTKNQFVKPFSNSRQGKIEERKQSNIGDIKSSSFTLCTTKHQFKAKIFQQNNKQSEQYSSILPLSNLVGQNMDGKFDRKIRQIGQVYYNLPNQSEQMRHLKKLPNTIIDEQNLLVIMDQKLQYLNLSYKNDISNDLINKIGYLAPNIKQLVLTAVPITNEVIVQLGKSCKNLKAIDISLCKLLEQNAILSFLKDSKKLTKISANHLQTSFTDSCLQRLAKLNELTSLNINFCSKITSQGIQFLANHQFQDLGLSSLPNVKGQDFAKLFTKSMNTLKHINMSFNNSKDINNALMQKLGMCTKLQTIILTGCQNISDQGINNLIYGQKGKGKSTEQFAHLTTLKVGGLINVSDQLHQLCKRCPALTFLQANNLQRLSDHFMEQIKGHQSLKTLMINFTPNISQEKLKDIKQTNKVLKIIRNIVKMTDPADDGLRMPIPPASMKIKKPKKKKK